MNPNQRLPEESYEAFKARRLKQNQDLKKYLRGKTVFNPYPKFLGTSPDGKPIWSSPQSFKKD